jgi:putative CocE/NonD family hydrolase
MKILRTAQLALLSFLVLASNILIAGENKDESFLADQAYIMKNYTKFEYEIPMRDGVKLFTAVYVPKEQTIRYPILLQRTPYGLRPYGSSNYPDNPRGPLQFYANERFIFAYQDVRGRNASGGEFVHMRPLRDTKTGPKDIDESTDTYDTIEWLVNNISNNNGKVGLTGISYPGFYTAAGIIDAHPALKCASPQAPIADWFIGDDFHHNGAFYLAHAFRFLSSFGQKLEKPTRQSPVPFDYETPDGYEFYLNLGPLPFADEKYFDGKIIFWKELMEHGTYDKFWQDRNILPHLKNIKPSVMTVGGWFDAEDLYGALNIYKSIENNSSGAYNILVMGPWEHGGWHRTDGAQLGNVHFNQNASSFFRNQIELPFLKHFLKDGAEPNLPEAFVFETGTNQWRKYEQWPPDNTSIKSLYFRPEGKLSFEPPAQSGENVYDEYISDPYKPVPFIPNIAIGMTREHMVDDQRFASSRTDVLVYISDVLSEDITIAGPITASLFVSTTGTDSDWVVKLIDVYSGDFPNPNPNSTGIQMGGYQQLVRGEAIRGKFRNSFTKPEPFVPGKVTKVEYIMPDVYHTFRRGHKIMVQVQSSWFPLVDRNPQKFVDIYNAKPEDFQKATQQIYRSVSTPSQVKVNILKR